MPRVVKKPVPPVDFAPISELEALNAADEAADDGLPAPNASNDSRGTLSIPIPKAPSKDRTPEPPEAPPAPVVVCALDGAPVNSKIVVIREDGKKRPVLMTPQGEKPVAPDDLAWLLPEGARIIKEAEGKYVGRQLDPAREAPDLIATTGFAVLRQFHQHFHG